MAKSEDTLTIRELSGEKGRLIDVMSSAYLQRSINSAVETTLQDQVNARNQRMLLMTKQLNKIVDL
ncbi:hypothetical protein ACJJIW_14905 [Microbulbifer sp. JMSA004]|uniref:hypothetical protein n=1 Tax=unclassified Microbulbifer TaxID=2619833 RepID=UPI0024ADBF97|nr:hypothetical protein [Microbulbifer sp. VAAF005]WHI47708.1 hypothetical protein P0078_04765 [Microbulbifer sp. VAAF005]